MEQNIFLIIAGLLSGGGLVAIINLIRSGKHDNIDYAKKIEEFYELRDSKLTNRIKSLESKVETLLKERDSYKKNIERWSNYAESLKIIIENERVKLVNLDTENQNLIKENEDLRKKLSKK